MDLASGFHQVAMDDQDKEKTAFCTPFSLFHYLCMLFGLTNSPATFQRLMQSVFADKIFKIMLVYIDDILAHSNTLAEHTHPMTRHGIHLAWPTQTQAEAQQVSVL